MSKRILLCDDEAHIVRAAEIKFTRAGYDVHVAFDGEEGMGKDSGGCPPDVVIVDCQMPRLNGIALAERIHNDPRTVHIPVIMLTGKGFELSHTEMREKYNILAVLSKPFSPRNLLERVEQLLNNQPQHMLAGNRFPLSRTGFSTRQPLAPPFRQRPLCNCLPKSLAKSS